mmetsp:Transcript_26781/g.37569  ORF Transcript_26781/g.37569 Transcript_26781/m.37569 type:complete len:237 (-) Transcript_26781:278-988(-)
MPRASHEHYEESPSDPELLRRLCFWLLPRLFCRFSGDLTFFLCRFLVLADEASCSSALYELCLRFFLALGSSDFLDLTFSCSFVLSLLFALSFSFSLLLSFSFTFSFFCSGSLPPFLSESFFFPSLEGFSSLASSGFLASAAFLLASSLAAFFFASSSAFFFASSSAPLITHFQPVPTCAFGIVLSPSTFQRPVASPRTFTRSPLCMAYFFCKASITPPMPFTVPSITFGFASSNF